MSSNARASLAASVLALGLLVPAIAVADREDDFPVARPPFDLPASTREVQAKQCAHGNGDVAINACNWVIASGIWMETELPWAYWDRGLEEYDAKQYDKAVADFTHRMTLKPDEAKVLRARGVTYREMGKLQLALDDLNTAVRLNPGEASTYMHRGVVEEMMKQTVPAMADFDKAVAVEPANARVRAVRAEEYYVKKDYPSALSDFNEAIALGDENAITYRGRGDTYRQLKQTARAIEDYDRALTLRPAYMLAFFGRGLANLSLHQYADAVADFDQVIGIGPEQSAAYNNRCWARAIWGQQYDLALADCSKAVSMRPHANPFASRAFVYIRLDKFADAIADCDAALKFDPKSADALYVRGLAKRKSGDTSGGDADIATAKAADATIAERYAGYGVTP